MESDSDSDSDYAPGKEEEEEEATEEVRSVANISSTRKRKAQSLFDEMVEAENKGIQEKMNKALRNGLSDKVGNNHKKKKSRKNKHIENVLKVVFGSSSSALAKTASREGSDNISNKDSSVKKAAREAVRNRQRKVTVSETKKFAGQTISVERSSESTGSDQPADQKTTGSLDKVLTDIKGPQAISTVSKSSIDWDNYKDKEGLEEDLATATKDGYLTRQDFLERCDYRAFENERDKRLQASKN